MRKTILVVEDSGSSRDVTSHFLQQGGFRTLEAGDGNEALAILKSRDVDLILTDIMMPGMDGWTFYKEVRKDKKYHLTPFVFLSVLDEMDDQVKGLGMGVDDYIPKPVTPPQLLARVNTALMRKERMSEFFYRNPVTELESANYFRYQLERETKRCQAYEQDLSLVVMGIGNYVSLVRGQAEWFAEKAANEAGFKLKSLARDFDLVADMGVGRFAVLLPGMNEADAKAWAEKVRGDWNLNLVWPETEQKIDIDIGFTVDAICPGKAKPLDVLNKRLESFERKW